jgi:DNA-directed RNA polymerase specialized sigma subunit
MDNKQKNLKAYLNSYYALNLSAKTLETTINTLEEELEEIDSLMNSQRFIEYHEKISYLITLLTSLLDEKVQTCIDILEKINFLDSELEKNILFLKYISCFTWEQIAECTNYSLRQVYNLHNSALNHLNDAL